MFLYFNQVSTSPTKEDIYYCEKIVRLNLDSIDIRRLSIDAQIDLVNCIQRRVIDYSYYLEIPFDEKREPKQLYEKKHGICFDRSRTIEKALSILGYKTRHVSIYLRPDSSSTNLIHIATIRRIFSHAASEVLINDKWMYISSIQNFISIDNQYTIHTLREMRYSKMEGVRWKFDMNASERFYQSSNSLVLYGFYSRHGKMYPPFLPFPNINYKDFLYNFTG